MSLLRTLTVYPNTKLERLVDLAIQVLEHQLAPKRRNVSHRITHVDLADVEQALLEMSKMQSGDIWGTEAPHVVKILETLYTYGVDEAQGRLEFG